MSDFLTGLSNMISDKFGIGENTNQSLDIVENGKVNKYGRLGDASKYIDQSAQRKYLEQGFTRLDPFNVNPHQFEILMQEPDATILIKKRAFSTLSENYRSDVMDQEEKLYFKAAKILFQNKCRQISAFEKLSKIERVSAAAGQLDDQLMPLIISLMDTAVAGIPGIGSAASSDLSSFGNSSLSGSFQKLNNVVDKIRKLYAFSPVSKYTSWITDQTNIFKTDFGQGTGVIEFTNIANFTTTTSVNFNNGSFNLGIADPYQIMIVRDYDIEKAISDASNFVANKKFFQLGKESLDDIMTSNIKRLNDARQTRGASNIEFKTFPDTFLGKKVVAIIEGEGIEINFNYNPIPGLSRPILDSGVDVPKEFLRGGPNVGAEGLDDGKLTSIGGIKRLASVSELSLFQDVIASIYTSLEYKKSSQSNIAKQTNLGVSNDPSSKKPLDVNYVRRKLQTHYMNQLIIQPMDQIHIYIGSKSKTDNKLLSGMQNMFSGLGFFQKLNNNVYDLKNQVSSLFNPSQNISLQLEKSTFVGPDFPNSLWTMMRNLFVNDKSGCHVFGGVVSNWSTSYSGGKYTANITGSDNASYFDFGTLNLNPGIDTFNGPLFDPLTPFKTSADVVTSNFKDQRPEFLEENKALIQNQTSDKGLIRYKSGRYAGKPITENSFFQDKEITKGGIVRNVYHAPDGLVYRWKEGIGTLVYSGDSFNATDPEKIGTIAITADPFAGQDVMNVLSLLITGIPYNFATYYKSARDFDTFGRDPQTGQDSALSFFKSLSFNLKKNNLLWGSFIPFKSLILDSESFQGMLTKQISVLRQNSEITNQLAKIQNLQNVLFKVSAFKGLDDQINANKQQLENEKNSLDIQLDALLIQDINNLSIIGNDVSFDPDQTQDRSQRNLSSDEARAELRKKLNFLTQRFSWAVRANEDKNLLIIDDTYDKDYDIIAIEKQLKGKIDQFANEYTSVKEKISAISNLLNLEVFCDTQGHIRIRPQQYNRMPSSVFYRMMQMKQNNGVQVYPNYLETLFVDQFASLLRRVEAIETQIRLNGAILGIADDDKLSSMLNNSGINTGTFVPFEFFSNDSGDIVQNLPSLLKSSNPEDSGVLKSFDYKLKQQNSATSVFNMIDRAKLITSQNVSNIKISTSLNSDAVNKYKNILFKKTGQQVVDDNFIIKQADGSVTKNAGSPIDILKVTEDLASNISERQKIIKTLASSFKNAQEALSLDADPKRTSNKLLFPNLYGNKKVPEIFSHMIEDETFDDLGPGSGTRYVIKEHQIMSFSRSGNPPPYTMIEVQGQFDPFVNSGSLPLGGAFSSNGNAIVSAAAVDYDLWRMYGFRGKHAIHTPYLSDPTTQCAPYAAALLSRARREILQATLTIAGNEYMQPGEVIYIESANQLYYVESVSHNFSFGTSFTTTLSLKYGHNPGEYIPTHLDVIGKLLYNNRDTASAINYRQSNIFNESQMGAIVINPQTSLESDLDVIAKGNYGEFNLKVINDILYSAAGVVASNNVKDSNVKAKVELRIFYDKSQGALDSRLVQAREIVGKILLGIADVKSPSLMKLPKLYFSESDIDASGKADIDISDKNERRSPSQKAMDIARSLIKTSPGIGKLTNNPLQSIISTYIIDCIVTFENQ